MYHKGFTLLELVVCCALISLLLAISFPYYGDMKQASIFKGEMRELYGNLRRAKVEAVKRNSHVVFTVQNQGYTIFVDDGEGEGIASDWVRHVDEEILTSHTFSQGVKLVKSTFVKNRTRFSGKSNVSAGRVILEDGRGAKSEIVMSVAGRLRIAKI